MSVEVVVCGREPLCFDVVDVIRLPLRVSGPAAVTREPVSGGRHPQWERRAKDFVRRHPRCSVCRAKSDLQVHHELPVHLFPAREMDESLWWVMCRRCHLFVGHLGDFQSYNPRLRLDAPEWAARFADRPSFGGDDAD